MSKSKIRPTTTRQNAPGPPPVVAPVPFIVRYPLLWLALAVVAVYGVSTHFSLTELDDSIFIRDFHLYNEDLTNLVTSFHRGLFDAVKDPYYRPLFMDSMILNYWLADHGQELAKYHIVNLLLHLGSVFILYGLFRKLAVKELHAFLLCLVFAVHPALSQAVAWIPGRNDLLLAIFVFSFLIYAINYANNGKLSALLLSALFLILAYFTKETAVFAAPVAFVLLVFVLNKKWNDKNCLLQYGVWAACFMLWYAVRATATIQTQISPLQVAHDFLGRLPLIVQYIGKVILPFNLSVFPTQRDTTLQLGFLAIFFLTAAILLAKQKSPKIILSGFAVFLLFLLPVLFVPNNLNEQSFEHRLYLPIVGILLLLPQTIILKNKFTDKQTLIGGLAVVALLSALTFQHEEKFEAPLTFWTDAAETSPHSAYANMMLAARLDKAEFNRSCELFRKAYQLNPNEKYLNYYMGEMLQKKDSVLASEPYLLKEKQVSNYYECDFYLARVAMEKKDLNGAIKYLQDYLKADPANKIANTNLLLLYIDTKQPEQARAQVKAMKDKGVEVPPQLSQQLGV